MRTLDRNAASLALLVLGISSTAFGQASWQLAYPAQSPPADYQWASAFDEVRGEAILMFPRGQSNQGWRWNGNTWSQLSGPLPPNRFASYMVWDVARQRVVLFGGFVPGTGQFHQDLWEWNGVVWQQRFAAMPPMRDGRAAVRRAPPRGHEFAQSLCSGDRFCRSSWHPLRNASMP